MSEPVKTALLKAIEAMLQGVAGLASIKRDWQFRIDLAATDAQGNPLLPKPALLFYEDQETLGTVNRQARNELDLDLVVFDAFNGPVTDESSPAWQSFKDKMDVIAALIHGCWYDRPKVLPLRAFGLIRLEERGNRKAQCNADYGEMVLTVRLTYGFPLGAAFTK